jgi:hypothetical protein
LLRPSHRRGKPAHRRVHAARRQCGDQARHRNGLQLFPAPARTPDQPGRLHVRWRTADDSDRAGADEPAENDPAGRAVDGAGAAAAVEEIFEIIKKLNEQEGVSFLLAEQNTNIALRYATYGYILESGRIVMDGAAKDLRENEDVKEFYLGVGGEGRRSFKNVKHYKRRKRWLA